MNNIADKQFLLNLFEEKSKTILTIEQNNYVINALNEILNSFDVAFMVNNKDIDNSLNYVGAFLDAKRIEGRSNLTIERYEYIIKKMLHQINVPIQDINIFHLRNYLMRQKEGGKSDKTLEGERSVICSFFNWLYKENLLKINPTANLSPIKVSKKIKIPYSNTDLKKLEENCVNNRDKAIIYFLFATGCRISEVCKLNKVDIDFINKKCKVCGKGDKERTVYVNDVTLMFLERYLNGRDDNFPSLFCGKGSSRMTPGGVRAMLRKLSLVSGVENVHPHRFRRTLATELIDKGMSIQEVSRVLGHAKLETTMIYCTIGQEMVATNHKKYMN